MKKFLSVFLALVLVFSVITAAFAADIDFAGMTDDEVIEMTKACQQELVDRGIGKSAELENGYYLVGSDFPAGSYIFTVTAAELTEDSSSYENHKSLFIFNSLEDMDEGGSLWRVRASTSDDVAQKVVSFNLQDGQYVDIEGTGTVTITITTGIEFK